MKERLSTAKPLNARFTHAHLRAGSFQQ